MMERSYYLYKLLKGEPGSEKTTDRRLCFSCLNVSWKNKQTVVIIVSMEKLNLHKLEVNDIFALEEDDGKKNKFTYFEIESYEVLEWNDDSVEIELYIKKV